MENVTLVPFEAFKQFATQFFKEELLPAINGMKVEKEDKLLSRTELAKVLGVTTATITTYKNNGLPYRMIKRRPYFLLSEVEKYMDLNKRKTKKR